MKICTVLGARPQFIKAAMVSRALKAAGHSIIHTGQHYDHGMSGIFFEELGLPLPDRNLGIGGGTHGQNTGRMIEAIERELIADRPDLVLVYGDTDSTLAGALAAVKLHIPVAHVEAGLRSFNRRMPEEINRVLTDHAADILFTPTKAASENLRAEGIDHAHVHQVGDVMYDAALYFAARAERESTILKDLSLTSKSYVLATLHREENTSDAARLRSIVAGLAGSVRPVLWPLHPRTKKMLSQYAIELPPAIRILEPVGYLDMIMLEKNAALIATDSGGVQKEAYFHGVPCLTLREETEWVELVEIGANRLVGADAAKIAAHLNEEGSSPGKTNLYGDGRSGIMIAEILERHS